MIVGLVTMVTPWYQMIEAYTFRTMNRKQ